MGITFVMFATPLVRERKFSYVRVARVCVHTVNLKFQKQQYSIRGVEKMQVAQNICQLSAEGRIEIVEKTIGESKNSWNIQRLIKGPKTHAAIILGIFNDKL